MKAIITVSVLLVFTVCCTRTLDTPDPPSFVRYTLDDTTHYISAVGGDSIYCSSTPHNATGIQAIKKNTPYGLIWFQFAGGDVGVFRVSFLWVRQYHIDSIELIEPFLVNVTWYPNRDTYLEGNFSGQFVDMNNITHTLFGTFRAKKKPYRRAMLYN